MNSIHLSLPSIEMKRRVMRTNVYYRLLYSIWKETTHKPSKVAAAECMLLMHTSVNVITRRHYLLLKYIVTLLVFFRLPCCCCLWNKCLVFYLRSNNIILIPKFQNLSIDFIFWLRFTFYNYIFETIFRFSQIVFVRSE